MSWEASKRRDRLAMARDTLISLELNGRPMKPTRLMYAMNMSWAPFKEMLRSMVQRQLIRGIRPPGYQKSKKTWDQRTRILLEITLKGKYVLRMLDEFLNYFDDENEPYINPPLWLMRKAFGMKGYDLTPPKDNPQLPLIFEELLSLEEDPVPDGGAEELAGEFEITMKPASGIPEDISVSLDEEETAATDPDEVIVIPDPEIARVKDPPDAVFCPECGAKCKGIGGLRIHVGHKHFEKRKEIMETVKLFEARRTQ